MLVTGKCTVGWEFGKCVSRGGSGGRVFEYGTFSGSVFDTIDTEFVVEELNQRRKKIFQLYWFNIHLLCCDCRWRWWYLLT